VHGEDGLDEISVCARTTIVEVDETGRRSDYSLTPEEFGVRRYPVEELRGGTAAQNAQTAREVLAGGGPGAIREAVLLNAGAALYISGIARNVGDGYLRAQEAVQGGAALAKLERIRTRSRTGAEAA
jgi:anthranilate phosphoribosyltransferase